MDCQGRRKVRFLSLGGFVLVQTIQLASYVSSYLAKQLKLVLYRQFYGQLYHLYVIGTGFNLAIPICYLSRHTQDSRYRPNLANLFYKIQFITPSFLQQCQQTADSQLSIYTDLYHSAFQIYHLPQLTLVITIACRHLFHV